jgi:hypothetical protein
MDRDIVAGECSLIPRHRVRQEFEKRLAGRYDQCVEVFRVARFAKVYGSGVKPGQECDIAVVRLDHLVAVTRVIAAAGWMKDMPATSRGELELIRVVANIHWLVARKSLCSSRLSLSKTS